MFRFSTIRRRLLLGGGIVLVLSGISLVVVHTGFVRRFVLVQIQTRLGQTMGLVVDAKELDYNLLASRYELKHIAVRGARLSDMPAPLQAQRVVVWIPLWRLLTGSFETAHIQIDGLAVDWLTSVDGRSNWPVIESKGGGKSGGPSVQVTGGSVTLRDDRNVYRVQLPVRQVSAAWKPVKSVYEIFGESGGGQLQWNGSRLSLDHLQLKAAAANGDVTVESLRLLSGDSDAEISGALSGSPARVGASAILNLNMRHLSQALGLSTPAQGRVVARVSATGLMQALQINATLQSDEIIVGGVPVRGLVAEALVDAATGEVQFRNLSAGLWSGQLRGKGRLSTTARARSEFTVGLDNLNLRQAAGAFGYPGAPNRRASLQFTASGPGLEWRRAAISGVARVQSAKVAFHATGSGGSVLASLDSSLGDSDAMRGDVTYRLADGSLSGTASGKIESLARFGSGLEELLDKPSGSLSGAGVEGAAQWSAVLGGTSRRPSASLQLQVNGLAVGGWNGADLDVKADYAQDCVQIESARLAWGGQQIDAKGEIGGLSLDAPLKLDGTVEGHSLAGVFQSLGKAQTVESSISGQFQIAGSVGHPQAEVSLRAEELTAFGQQFADAHLKAHWQDGAFTLDRFAAEQPNESGTPGRLEASGRLNVANEQYEVEAEARDLRLTDVEMPGGLPLSGTFQFKAHGKGSLSDPGVEAEISGAGLKIGSTELGELTGKVDGAGHRATALLTLPDLNAKASSTIRMEGEWPFELTVEAPKAHLETSPAASFDASIHASGTLFQPRVERATAGIQNFRLATHEEEILTTGPIDLSYADGKIQLRELALKSGASTLRVSGQMPLQEGGQAGSVSLRGSLDLAPLSKLLPASGDPQIGGVLDVDASVAGSVENWQPGGSLTVRDGRLQSKAIPFTLENITGRVSFEDGTIQLREFSGKAGTGTLRFDGSVPLGLISSAIPVSAASPDQKARFSGQLEKLSLSGGSGEHAANVTLDAMIEGEASALALSSLQATVELNNFQANAGSSHLQQASPTHIAIADNVVRLEQLDLRGEGSSLKAAGSIGLTGSFPLQLVATGETDLAVFAAMVPSVEAAGAVRMDLRVGGTLSDPQATGFVELDKASLMLANPPIQATNVKLRAEMEGKRVTLKQLSGNLNGGAFQGGGDLELGAAGISEANLFLKGKDVFAEYPASLKTTSSVDAKLVSREGRLVLEGQIEVQDGYIESTLDLFSKSGPNLDASAEGGPEASRNAVGLDLKIVTKRPVEMDNNLGRLSAMADLRLAGTTEQPRLVGTLRLEEDGRLYFGDRTYYVERGTVRFVDAPEITPELDIHAYTRTNDYTIKLGLTGQLNEITTTFTSDPPLSRDDVIAVLLTGKTVADNRGVDLRALEATSLATGALNASLSSQMHRTFGVSRVSIQPEAVAAESNPGARVTITQDFTQSLRLMYSMNLSDSNDQIWVGEYDLSRRFTTRAVKQSDNTYRGEFRHDIQFGSSSGSAAAAATRSSNQKISQLRFSGAEPFAPDQLAKIFKVKAGQQYKAIKVRKASERLANFLGKQGYLESRVHLDRQDDGQGVDLTVRIELGPIVELAFQGTSLPKSQVGRLRKGWRSGISDQQRPLAAKAAIHGYFAEKGYLRAETDIQISGDAERKSVRFDIKPGTKYQGVKIVVEGAEAQRAQEILSLVQGKQLKQSVYTSQSRVADAVTAYYRQRGYLAAKVGPSIQDLDADRRTGRIVIAVEEGPKFHVGALQFSGNQALTAADLQAGLQLEEGAVFEPARVEPTLAALKLKYGKLGYREAHIGYGIERHDDRATVDVSFKIEELRQTSIGAIKVEGNRHTSEKFARSQLRVGEGQVANTQLVRESVKNLSQTGAYTSADIQVRPVVESDTQEKSTEVADLVVGVTEPKPFRLLYGGLYDSGNGPGFIADLQNHNSFGAGRVLGLRTRVDPDTDEIRLYLTQPTLRSRRISTTMGTYYTRETENYQTTPTEKLGISIQQDLQLPSKLLLSYGYRYEKQRGFIPDPAAPYIPESIVTVAPIMLTIARDTRDSFLDATRGSFVSHGIEFAPSFLGSDYPYLRYYGQYFKYFALTSPHPAPFGEKPKPSRLVFATGSRIGLQKGFNSTGAVLTDRFYAGGGTTVCGFRQDELGPKLATGQPAGGNAVLVLNEELRYPLFWIFDAVSFVDVGNVFPRVSDFRISDLRAAGGFGLRIRNPFVVLRFDYGVKFNRRPGESRGAFFFSIGQAF